ncbi:MAG: hypothetical protein WA854_15030 [Candidatus Binataceae bacterium]
MNVDELAAKLFAWVQHQSQRMEGLAIAVGPLSLAMGTLAGPSSTTAMRGSSAHELFLTAVALTIEIAMFISIPMYLRAKRRDKIRSRIHIVYDSRRDRSVQSLASPADSKRVTAAFSSTKPPISSLPGL